MPHEVADICVRKYIRGKIRRDGVSKLMEVGNMVEDLRHFRETRSNT
jgi:hypothetical protein